MPQLCAWEKFKTDYNRDRETKNDLAVSLTEEMDESSGKKKQLQFIKQCTRKKRADQWKSSGDLLRVPVVYPDE